MTLAAWQAGGAYTVTVASTKSLSLIASSVDVGATLLSDAKFHLDHAVEHQAALLHDLRSGQWNRPAWLLTTFYYWSYFAAMSLTRMLGDTVWFVNDSVAAQLSKLASSATGKLGAGTFQFICDAAVSASDRTLTMKKRSRRIHEQLWRTTFDLLDGLYKSGSLIGLDPREQRLYLAILTSAKLLGPAWPSDLRNTVNYRPGFAYDAVRAATVLDSLGFLKVDGAQDVDDVVGRLETNVIAVSAAQRVEEVPRLGAHMLVDMTILLNLVARTLHEEIVERRGLDRRWVLRRAQR